jgi:hypothetical protein
LRLTRGLTAILLVSLIVHVGLLILLPGDGTWAEAIYARGIYPVLGPVIAFISAQVPFSLALMVLCGLLLWIPVYLILNIVRCRRGRLTFWRASEQTLAAFAIVAVLGFHAFYLFWGYNYLRPPLEQRLGLGSADLSAERQSATARLIVGQAVAARVPVPAWDRTELNALIDGAIDSALRDLEGRGTPVVSPLKGDWSTGLLAMQGNRGVISPFTLEAHVDFGLPAFALPFTAAHEKAHLAGFARERDANFVAWYALTHSNDPRLRYSGYVGVLNYFLNPETRRMALPLEADLRALSDYRSRTISEPLQRKSLQVYGAYLRANRMGAGLADYSQVAQLIQAWLQHGD